MRTIEEIKVLLNDEINWGDILKDVLLQKVGEGKLISFDGVYSHSLGDPDSIFKACVVSNNQLVVYSEVMFGGDSDGFAFGVLETDKTRQTTDNNFISQNALKEAIRLIVNDDESVEIEYDFNNEMEKDERKDECLYRIYSSWLNDESWYEEVKNMFITGIGCIHY